MSQHSLYYSCPDKPEEYIPGDFKPSDIEGKHPRHQGHHHHHHGKFSGRHSDDRRVGELDGHHEYHHRHQGREQSQPAHPLAVKDEEEGEVDQCRTCLFLGKNEQHWHEYYGQRLDIIGAFGVEVEVV